MDTRESVEKYHVELYELLFPSRIETTQSVYCLIVLI